MTKRIFVKFTISIHLLKNSEISNIFHSDRFSFEQIDEYSSLMSLCKCDFGYPEEEIRDFGCGLVNSIYANALYCYNFDKDTVENNYYQWLITNKFKEKWTNQQKVLFKLRWS